MTLTVTDIMDRIPHRYPFLMVDKVVEMEPNKRGVGIKNVTINEPFFQGHFPGHPVMPGVMIIEALAQLSALVVFEGLEDKGDGKLVYFTSIENAKFRKPVVPGDQLTLNAIALQNKKTLWKFEIFAEVDGKKVTEATISAMMMDRPA